jgi:hypothetical protein
MQFYKTYCWIIISVVLITWIMLTPSHLQKGGVESAFYFLIAIFVTLISVLIVLLFDNFTVLEKIIAAIIFSFLSLFVTTLILVPAFVDNLYDGKTWFLWKTKDRIIANTIYYGSNAIILFILSAIYFQLRRKLKRKQSRKLYA